MPYFDWDEEKNQKLISEREISFQEIIEAIDSGNLIDVIDSPNQKKHKGQKTYVLNIENYIYLVPFVEDSQKVFLKTIFPSRKITKSYLKKIKEKK